MSAAPLFEQRAEPHRQRHDRGNVGPVLRRVELVLEEGDELVGAPAPLENAGQEHGGVDLRRIFFEDLSQETRRFLLRFRALEERGGLLEAKSASLGGRFDERQRLGDEPDELVACFELSVDLEKGPPDVAIGGGLLAKSRVDPRRAAEIAVRTHRDFRDVEKQRATFVGRRQEGRLLGEVGGAGQIAGLQAKLRKRRLRPHRLGHFEVRPLQNTGQYRIGEQLVRRAECERHGVALLGCGGDPELYESHQRVAARRRFPLAARHLLVEPHVPLVGRLDFERRDQHPTRLVGPWVHRQGSLEQRDARGERVGGLAS